MIEFLFASINSPYFFALCFVLAIGVLEILGLLFGLSISNMVDNISPFDIDADLDTGLETTGGGLSGLIGWLKLDRVPLMFWLLIYLTSFGIIGFTANFLVYKSLDLILSSWLVVPIVLFLALLVTARFGGYLSLIMPKNETSAVETFSFSGKIATIAVGKARKGFPAEASLVDEFEQKHYVMVEPIESNVEFLVGDRVVLIEKESTSWSATKLD